jgi:hypothetical protein
MECANRSPFNQKLHHHQRVIQTQIGFDGDWSGRNLPPSNTVPPTDSVLDPMHHCVTAEVPHSIATEMLDMIRPPVGANVR